MSMHKVPSIDVERKYSEGNESYRHISSDAAVIYATRPIASSPDFHLSFREGTDSYGWWYTKQSLGELRDFITFLMKKIDEPVIHNEWMRIDV